MYNYISYTSTNTGDWGGCSSETFVFPAKNDEEALEMISYYLSHYPSHMNAYLHSLDRINKDSQIVAVATEVLSKKALKSRTKFEWIAVVLDDGDIVTRLHGTIRDSLMARIGLEDINDRRELIARCQPFNKDVRKKHLIELQSGYWAFDKHDLRDIKKLLHNKGYKFSEKTDGSIGVEKLTSQKRN